jgi:heat shock protein HtpX
MILLGIVMSIINTLYPGLLTAYGGIGNLLLMSAVLWFLWAFVSLAISKWSAKKLYNIELLTDGNITDPKLKIVWDTVERIAQANTIKMPEVGYYVSSDPNAFATGMTKNSSLVAVSIWLLDVMDTREIEWVVGHEMAHILNGDMVTLTLIQGIMNTFVYFISHIVSRIVTNFLSRWEGSESMNMVVYNIVVIISQIVFGLLASLVVMWFSRIREYRADLGWAQYTSKAAMIAWLKKLQKITDKMQPQPEGKMAAFMIAEPDSFFSTHPSLINRIKALEENYQLP